MVQVSQRGQPDPVNVTGLKIGGFHLQNLLLSPVKRVNCAPEHVLEPAVKVPIVRFPSDFTHSRVTGIIRLIMAMRVFPIPALMP